MNAELRKNKAIIRDFLKQYSDERLVMLLDHARAGKLAYNSCCCLIGIATADHALKPHLYIQRAMGLPDSGACAPHYKAAERLLNAAAAEVAYRALGPEDEQGSDSYIASDAIRRRRVIPLILAELKRRRQSRCDHGRLLTENCGACYWLSRAELLQPVQEAK